MLYSEKINADIKHNNNQLDKEKKVKENLTLEVHGNSWIKIINPLEAKI